jgi:hypothetical protein
MLLLYMLLVLIFSIMIIIYIHIKNNKFDDKPIKFYHPIIRQKYCKIIIISQYKPNMKILMDKLIEENNILLEKYPFINMSDRLDKIKKTSHIQTIFNLIDI